MPHVVAGPGFKIQISTFHPVKLLSVYQIKQIAPLRFRKLRRKKVADLVLRPNKKSRHEKMVLKELIKKCEEDYVDFQQVGIPSLQRSGLYWLNWTSLTRLKSHRR